MFYRLVLPVLEGKQGADNGSKVTWDLVYHIDNVSAGGLDFTAVLDVGLSSLGCSSRIPCCQCAVWIKLQVIT